MRRLILTLLCSLLLSPATAAGQGAAAAGPGDCEKCALYGRVVASDISGPMPPWWVVQISAKRVGDDRLLDRVASRGDIYCAKVPLRMLVYLTFESPFYDPQDSRRIDTNEADKRHSWLLPNVRLNRIRSSSLKPPPQGDEPDVGLVARLHRHREAAKSSQSYDIFLWNLETYRHLYREDAGAKATIDRFTRELAADAEFGVLTTDDYKRRLSLYRYVIARSSGAPVDAELPISAGEITMLLSNEQVFPGIRAEVINALSAQSNEAANEEIVGALVAALGADGSELVRLRAAQALGRFATQPEALRAVQRAADEDESDEVRDAAKAASQSITAKLNVPGEGRGRPKMTKQVEPAPPRAVASESAAKAAPTAVGTTIEGRAEAPWSYRPNARTVVELIPTSTLPPRASATAYVWRADEQTTVTLNASGLGNNFSSLYVYALTPGGEIARLGPAEVERDGTVGKTFTTQFGAFMILISPEPHLTSVSSDTRIAFYSGGVLDSVASGRFIGAYRSGASEEAAAAEEGAATTAAAGESSGGREDYIVPMLGVSRLKPGRVLRPKINFMGELAGARADIDIERRRHQNQPAIKIFLYEVMRTRPDKTLILWAVTPTNEYIPLGNISVEGTTKVGGAGMHESAFLLKMRRGSLQVSDNRSGSVVSVSLPLEFGLLLTLEPSSEISSRRPNSPSGPVVGKVVPQ